MSDKLDKEFDYYIKNQEELVKQYQGKYIVIKDEKVIGSFDKQIMAIRETMKTHKIGTFLVQLCESGEENYTKTFTSRVAFL
jgi:hypothetical protein